MTRQSVAAVNDSPNLERSPRVGLSGAVSRHPLVAYFALAFCLSWGELLIVARFLNLPAVVAISLTTLAPTAAALIVTVVVDGRAGLRELWRRVLQWRVPVFWYFAALVLVPLAYIVGTLILPGGIAGFAPPSRPVYWVISSLIATVIILVLGGPLFEEPGWRGFALPRLEAKFGPLGGTLILGVLWGCWHLPQYLIPEWAAQNAGLSFGSAVAFLIVVIAFTVILSWIWNGTGGSLLLAIVAHTGINATQGVIIDPLFPGFAGTEVNALIGFGIMAIIIVALTRGRLGVGSRS